MSEVFDRYFSLSDAAISDAGAFEALIGMFADDAVIYPDEAHSPEGGGIVSGVSEIKRFYKWLLDRNRVLHHTWTAVRCEDGHISVGWAVAGLRKSGEVFSAQGMDTVELDDSGRIKRLVMR